MPGKCPRNFYDLARKDEPRPDEGQRCHVYLYSEEGGAVFAKATYEFGDFRERETDQPGEHVIQDWHAYQPFGWRPFKEDLARYAERWGELPQ